jgi:hypothetical protein
MAENQGRPSDEASSAPESGTARDDTSGNGPSDRGLNPAQKSSATSGKERDKDDPAVAGEER